MSRTLSVQKVEVATGVTKSAGEVLLWILFERAKLPV